MYFNVAVVDVPDSQQAGAYRLRGAVRPGAIGRVGQILHGPRCNPSFYRENTMSTVYEVNSEAEVVLPLLSHLLKMADDYRRDGSPHQAIEMDYELAERNADSFVGQEARCRLLEIAEEYEQQDMPHEARSIYERLLVEQKV